MGSAMTVRPLGQPYSERYGDAFPNQGIGAEMITAEWGLSRQQLDEYSLRSHEKAAAAQDEGRFAAQIVPVNSAAGMVSGDEGIRRGGTVEKFAALRPVSRDDGVVHAGNASQISDGAAALLMTSSERAAQLGLTPIARLHTRVPAGRGRCRCSPRRYPRRRRHLGSLDYASTRSGRSR